MAELSISGASTKGMQDEDRDFEPTADMLVHEFDDEQTMEEEEMLQGETNFNSEIDDLTREGEMPLQELLKMYGYGAAESADSEDEGPEEPDDLENDQSSSAHENIKSNKEDREDEDHRSCSEESPEDRRTPSTAHLLCSDPRNYFDVGDADESEDEDYIPSEEWKKEVKVGPMYQAETPTELCKYEDNEKVYENEDQLLWNPELLPENEVVEFLAEASRRVGEQTEAEAVPEMSLIKDNEEALYELIKCNFNKEEALKKLKFNPKPVKDELPVWTQEERHEFEQEEGVYGNDFTSMQADKIKLWRRKPDLHPCATPSTVQMLAETESTEPSRAAAVPTGVSDCRSTAHNGADSYFVDPTSSCGSVRTTSEETPVHSGPDPDISSSNSDAIRRQRGEEDEEDSERTVKKPKTEVEFLAAAAV